MALQPIPANSYYGIIPGSAHSNPLGSGAGYEGIGSLMQRGPGRDMNWDYLTQQHQQDQWGQQDSDWNKKNKLYDQLLGDTGSSNFNFKSWGQPIMPPAWASTAGVWSQDQVNNQANSQRAQLMAQAANQTRGYATSAASHGFSPMSPLTQFMQQTSNQRAGASAASNESNLNWTAAQGNREASQRGESINAGLYGSYTNAQARQQEIQLQAQQQQNAQRMQQYQLLTGLIGR